jgi:hypothetical protein
MQILCNFIPAFIVHKGVFQKRLWKDSLDMAKCPSLKIFYTCKLHG